MQPDEIEQMIKKAIPDAQVQVEDTTSGGDHFSVSVVSEAFDGKSLIEQHQLVNRALHTALDDGRIHALQVRTRTPGNVQPEQKSNDEGLNIIG
jgi:stress-induced morphogen